MSNDIIQQLTIAEAVALAKKAPPAGANSSRKDRPDGWAGGTFDEAIDKALNGDRASALLIKQKPGVIASIQQARRATSRYGTSGSTVDVGRFLSGEPECMVDTVRARRSSPVIRLAIERAVSFQISDSDIRATGASVLAVVEALRTAGVPSEVWVTTSVRGNGSAYGTMSTQVLVQEAGRPINIERLAWWATNSGVLRRLAFAIWEQQPAAVRSAYNIGGNYGYPTKTPDEPKFDEVAPAYEREVEQWITSVLSRRAGVTVNA